MFVTKDARHVVVPWRADLANVIPHSREVAYNSQRMLVIPNRTEEARVARNLGVGIPAPILSRYDWRGGKPWDVQRTTAALLSESARAYCLNSFGTGKTRSTIWACDYLRQYEGAGRVLIAAPLSTLTPVWEAELFKVLPRARVKVLHGSRAQRLERLAEDADFYIINHHGLTVIREELANRGFDVVVLDELATFRNRSTRLWKSAFAVINQAKYVWGLTGSPTPRSPVDAWAQVRLLTPERTVRTMTRFRDLTMRQITTFKWAKRPGAEDIVHEAMQPSVRFALDDVIELPPTTYRTQQVPLDPECARAYKLLYEKFRIMTNNGELVTAVNEGVLQSKLLQISMGYVYSDKRGVFRLPNTNRLEAVLDIVEANQRKVIVFVPFIHALEGLSEFLNQHKINLAVVNGSTPIGERNKIFRRFQETPEPHVLLAHPQCMSHGLTLTSANVVVWFGPITSFEIYEQANARIVRPSQTSKTLILHLSGTAVERIAYQRLRERGLFQGLLLELFRQQEIEVLGDEGLGCVA